MHDPAAERILVHLAPTIGKREGVGALGGGSFGRPYRLDFDARIREGPRPYLCLSSAGSFRSGDSIAVMAIGALCGGCRERQDDERHDRACERHQRRSTHARVVWGAEWALGYGPHGDGCASLFAGWPPRAATLATHTLRVSLEVNLLGPPMGAALWLVKILGKGGNEGIGQSDHFVMVQFAHVLIRQND